MSDHPNVAIFWDYENCSPPSSFPGLGYDLVNNIRRIARVFGSVITFKAYLNVAAQSAKSVTLRSELQSSGVSMIDCPHNGKKDVVDKMILVDMLAFAVDHPAPATVILITGDRDYSYAVSTLRLRTYQVILVVPSPQHTVPCLESQASLVIDWGAVILRTRTEAVSSTQAIKQQCLDLDPNLTTEVSRVLRELTLSDPDATLLHPYATGSPSASRLRRTCAQDLEQSKHPRSTGSIGFAQDLGYSQALPRKHTATRSDPVPGGLPIPKTPSRSRCASVSMGSTQARSAAQLAEDIPPKNPLSSSARRSSVSDVADIAGSAKHSPSMFSSKFDAPELPLHDNRPPSSIKIGSPLEPVYSTDNMPESSSSQKPNCLASPFVMTKTRTEMELMPTSLSRQSHAAINPSFPSMTPMKTLVEPVISVCKTPNISVVNVPTEIKRIASDDENSERSIRHRVFTKGGASDVTDTTDTPQSNHHPYAALSLPSRNMGVQSIDTPSSKHESLPAVAYLGTGDGVDLAQLQLAAFSDASLNVLDHCTTRGFELAVPSSSSSASPPASYTESHERDTDENELRQAWTMFRPLIHLLLEARGRGITHPLRSTIAMDLVQLDKQVYRHAGVLRFRDYTALAERAGIIELGGKEAEAWISLHPNWFGHEGVTTTHSLSDRASSPTYSDPPKVIGNPLSMGTKASLTETPAILTMPTPAPISTPISAPLKFGSFERSDMLPTAPTGRYVRTSIPAPFQPLIDTLIRLRDEGVCMVLRSLVGQSLGQGVYAQAGVSGFKEYIQQALDLELVQLGGTGGKAWISLHPELLTNLGLYSTI